MVFFDNFSVILSKRTFSLISNTGKTNVQQRSILFKNFSKLQETTRFCFNDCVSLLQVLGDVKQLNHGRSLHSLFIKTGFIRDVFVQNNMVKSYALLGDILSARILFDQMTERNLVSWTSMISAYIHGGEYENGLSMFSLMCRSGFQPNEFGFSVALKACRVARYFVTGMLIHGQIMKCGFQLFSFCSASVLAMYVEYGDIVNARKFFDGIPLWGRSEALWNTLLDSYVQSSKLEEAITLFSEMRSSSLSPNSFTYSILVKLCANMLTSDLGRLFHGKILKVGFDNDVIVGGAIVDAYAKWGFMDDACKAFLNLEELDNVVWCSLMAGFHQIGDDEQGLNVYLRFLSEGNIPDSFIYASVFNLCSNSESWDFGEQVHCTFIKDGLTMDSFLGSVLIGMYGGIGMVSDAYKCFLKVNYKNEISFRAMINILILHSFDERALELFSEMLKLGIVPSVSTISYILRACANLNILKEGRSLHSYIVKNLGDVDFNLCLGNDLVEMYSKFGEVDNAKVVFKGMQLENEFAWTAIILACSELGQFHDALCLFRDLLMSSESAKPSEFTVIAIIQACTNLEALDKGKQVHGYATKVGFESYHFVKMAFINLYAAFKHEIQNVYLLFSSMNEKDLVSWSAMIAALHQNGYKEEALKLFAEFRISHNFSADESILSSCLSACAGLASLEMGKCIHAYIMRTGFASQLHVVSSILDMYSKCGSIKDAENFFNEVQSHNSVTWTAMVTGYAHNGLGKEAIAMFKEMQESGVGPDGVTFVGVLTACSHAGLVEEGWQYFESMSQVYGVKPTISHYACMVDLLGRSAKVGKAEALIKNAPFDLKLKSLLWKTLLGACSKYGHIEIGERVAQILVELEPNDPSIYVLISNIYASASMWDNSNLIRNKMKKANVSKQAAYSWTQVGTLRFYGTAACKEKF